MLAPTEVPPRQLIWAPIRTPAEIGIPRPSQVSLDTAEMDLPAVSQTYIAEVCKTILATRREPRDRLLICPLPREGTYPGCADLAIVTFGQRELVGTRRKWHKQARSRAWRRCAEKVGPGFQMLGSEPLNS